MSGTWVPFTNQKLYLAKLQFELMVSVAESNAPLRESARQAGLSFLQTAWVGLLNEIAESFKVKNTSINSLSDLEKALGATISEVSPLLALHEDPHSWLRILQREYETCLRPQPKAAVSQGHEPLRIAVSDQEASPRYQLILQDLKDYVTAFRDRTYEW